MSKINNHNFYHILNLVQGEMSKLSEEISKIWKAQVEGKIPTKESEEKLQEILCQLSDITDNLYGRSISHSFQEKENKNKEKGSLF